MSKNIEFRIQFEKPTKAEVISELACPYCKAPRGERCSTKVWSWADRTEGGNRMSDLHADRYALYMNLEIVSSGMLYRIKG